MGIFETGGCSEQRILLHVYYSHPRVSTCKSKDIHTFKFYPYAHEV